MSKDLIAYSGIYCGACSIKVAFDSKNKEHIILFYWKKLERQSGWRFKMKNGRAAVEQDILGI